MRLIARRPCSFGGKKYFIGDEVPAEDVINPTDRISFCHSRNRQRRISRICRY